MTKLILFIETPRAGKHNHRFIAPDGYTGGDSALSQWADFARQQAQGADCFSARREVTQQTSGRTGVEQLILAGEDAKQLSKKQSATVRDFLQQHLLDVDRLVTQSIDWDTTTKNIVLRTELNQWQLELEKKLDTIPAVSVDAVKKDTPKRKQLGGYWQLIVAVIVLVSIGIAVVPLNKRKVPPFDSLTQGDEKTGQVAGSGTVVHTTPKLDTSGQVTIPKTEDTSTTTQLISKKDQELLEMFKDTVLVSMLWQGKIPADLRSDEKLIECASKITLLIGGNTDAAMSLKSAIEKWANLNKTYVEGTGNNCKVTSVKKGDMPFYNWVKTCIVRESSVEPSTDNDTLEKIKNLYETCACAVTASSQKCQKQ